MSAVYRPNANEIPTEAVIFDVDGVLVDSFDAHFASWRQLAAETGVHFSEQNFAESFGRTSREIIALHWAQQRPSSEKIEELDARKENIYRELVAESFPAMQDAAVLVHSLHETGYQIALGSSGPAENVELAQDRLGIRDCIDAVVTGRDVTRGKPDPQVFLLAAKKLGVPRQNCCVIEDAPAGVQAARSADMPVIAMLSRGHHEGDFAKSPPDRFVHALREIGPAMISALIQRNLR